MHSDFQAVIIFKSATYEDPTAPGWEYTEWTLVLGWFMVAFTMFWIPTMAVAEVISGYMSTGVSIFIGKVKVFNQ